MKRIALFVLTNLAVLVLLSIVARLFGLDLALARQGIDMGSLLVMAAVIGFVGSFISLAISKWSAKHLMGVRIIETPRDGAEQWLVDTVRSHAQRVGIGMPEVGVFDAPEMNAFATGARRNSALVAVSTGLLRGMSQDEAEAVLGHEITHVANGDMVTLALIQGVVNTFVIFLSRAIGSLIDGALRGGSQDQRRGPGPFYFLIVMVLQIALGLLANIVVMWFSRQREFRADAGGAELTGTSSMIGALERLESQSGAILPGQFKAFGIDGDVARGLQRLFMSHPPISERIAALRSARYSGLSMMPQ
ncbi:protease HtpX [Peristeroidobacter soli]|jgi:heat shock protein HtpX|uniref:protease HtpX n=1 Tax=Peristeroidobacter soli TaxID=2497877 RepID=UPI00101D82DC|nr:protease HtpX [Peristeroidobacter soli]